MRIKIKINEEKLHNLEYMQHLAKGLGLFDDKFPDENQGGGYHSFKELCLNKIELPSFSENNSEQIRDCMALGRFHPSIRWKALVSIHVFRTKLARPGAIEKELEKIKNLKNKKDVKNST